MKTAITPTRSENFSEWYQNLIVAADLAENAPVRGCMTIKPYGWAIWELMRDALDKRIKKCGVQNAQFPLLIPINFFNREAEHVAGFAKETAVVTHYRLKMIDGTLQPDPDAKLTEPYVIRPTSETIIGEAMNRHTAKACREEQILGTTSPNNSKRSTSNTVWKRHTAQWFPAPHVTVLKKK